MDCEQWPKIEGPPARQTTHTHTLSQWCSGAVVQRSNASTLETRPLNFIFPFHFFFSFWCCVPGASVRRSGEWQRGKKERESMRKTYRRNFKGRVPARARPCLLLCNDALGRRKCDRRRTVAQEPRCSALPKRCVLLAIERRLFCILSHARGH